MGQSVNHPVNVSVNQSVCQSVSQLVNHSVCQPVNLLICQSVCQSISLSTSQSINLSISQPVCLSIYQSVNLSFCQSVCQSISLSTSQSVNQSISQPASLSVNISISKSLILSITSLYRLIDLSMNQWHSLSFILSILQSVLFHTCLANLAVEIFDEKHQITFHNISLQKSLRVKRSLIQVIKREQTMLSAVVLPSFTRIDDLFALMRVYF